MKAKRREYITTYRQRLTAKELRYTRTIPGLESIEEVTPAGWTRRLPKGKGREA